MKQSNGSISHVPLEPCQPKTCGGLFGRMSEGDWLNHLTVTVRGGQWDWFATSRATWSQFSASCWCEAVRHGDVLLTSGRETVSALRPSSHEEMLFVSGSLRDLQVRRSLFGLWLVLWYPVQLETTQIGESLDWTVLGSSCLPRFIVHTSLVDSFYSPQSKNT